MEPTSEQELKQLLDEGRITEEEYRELLEAIRQKETVHRPVEKPNEPKPRTGYGKAALVLFLLSIVIPVISIILAFVLGAMKVRVFLAVPFIFLGLLCGLLAFIFGIIGWKTPQGKIAAIGVPCLGLLIVPGLVLLKLFSFRAVAVPAPIDTAEARVPIRHKSYPMDTLEGLISQDMAVIDEDVYVNGGGSLRIKSDSAEKRVVRLFETGPIPEVRPILIYSAKVKSELDNGRAYLEMWYVLPGRGEFFSRGIEQPITGSKDWMSMQIPFQVKYGTPLNVKLNLVIEGVGTIWLDDIQLSSSPLN